MSKEALRAAYQILGRRSRRGKTKLPPAARLLLLHFGGKQYREFPIKQSIRSIAKTLGISKSTAEDAVNLLLETGDLVVIDEQKRGQRTERSYQFAALVPDLVKASEPDFNSLVDDHASVPKTGALPNPKTGTLKHPNSPENQDSTAPKSGTPYKYVKANGPLRMSTINFGSGGGRH